MYYVAAAAHGKLQTGEVSCQMHVVRTQMTRLRSVQLYRVLGSLRIGGPRRLQPFACSRAIHRPRPPHTTSLTDSDRTR